MNILTVLVEVHPRAIPVKFYQGKVNESLFLFNVSQDQPVFLEGTSL